MTVGDKIVLRGGPLDGAVLGRAELDRLVRKAGFPGCSVIRFATPDGRTGVYRLVNGQWVHVPDHGLPPGFTRPGPL